MSSVLIDQAIAAVGTAYETICGYKPNVRDIHFAGGPDSKAYRAVLVACLSEHLTQRQISEALGISLMTVINSKRLFEASSKKADSRVQDVFLFARKSLSPVHTEQASQLDNESFQESATVTVEKLDQFVGQKIRQRRLELGLSQGNLASQIGITTQQWQKYETGLNRITAGRLYEIAQSLQVPITYFFPEQPDIHALMSKRGRIKADKSLSNNELMLIINELGPQIRELVSEFIASSSRGGR